MALNISDRVIFQFRRVARARAFAYVLATPETQNARGAEWLVLHAFRASPVVVCLPFPGNWGPRDSSDPGNAQTPSKSRFWAQFGLCIPVRRSPALSGALPVLSGGRVSIIEPRLAIYRVRASRTRSSAPWFGQKMCQGGPADAHSAILKSFFSGPLHGSGGSGVAEMICKRGARRPCAVV